MGVLPKKRPRKQAAGRRDGGQSKQPGVSVAADQHHADGEQEQSDQAQRYSQSETPGIERQATEYRGAGILGQQQHSMSWRESQELPGAGVALGQEKPGTGGQERQESGEGGGQEPRAGEGEPEQRRAGGEHGEVIGEAGRTEGGTTGQSQRPAFPLRGQEQQIHACDVAKLRQSKAARDDGGVGKAVGQKR
jgi:hypothetical protein